VLELGRPVDVVAGPQRVAAAFIARFDAPVDDLIAPIEHTMADSQIGSGFGITALPHLREFAITGPVKVTSRRFLVLTRAAK